MRWNRLSGSERRGERKYRKKIWKAGNDTRAPFRERLSCLPAFQIKHTPALLREAIEGMKAHVNA
jgi:hypothetical protein